ncbi:MAG TPA: hypothetical protein PKW62_07070, partial [Chitinophagaceae bacterium]|nr:hypothetical protein [Chitinophagaceae bacterium]
KHLATFNRVILVCIIAAVVVNGCRKTDKIMKPPVTVNNNNNVEQRFFNEHTSTEPLINALNGFLQRTNDTLHFVEKTVSRIGYPRWDKALSFTKPSAAGNRGNSADSATITYIPFVRDSQNYVNATMVVESNPTDTSFSYNCDWQYAQKQNSLNSYTDTAEYYAVFFMVMDKRVFGHQKFKILDTLLFKYNIYKPLNIQFNDLPNAGRNAFIGPVEHCEDVPITFQYCPYILNQGHCFGPGGTCDNCPTCLNTTATINWTYCWTEYIEPGGGSGTGDGSGGDGGATGGEGGGGTPPDCNPIPTEGKGNRIAINNTCGPGWEPVPIEDEPPPEDPCSDAQVAAQNAKNLASLPIFINAKNEALQAFGTDNKEHAISFGINSNGEIIRSPMNTGGTYSGDIPNIDNRFADLHNHTQPTCPSPGDIYRLIDLAALANSYLRFVVTPSGAVYALAVLDVDKAGEFILNYPEQQVPGYSPNFPTIIVDDYYLAYSYLKNVMNVDPLIADEMATAMVLEKYHSNVALLKQDSNGNFKRLRTTEITDENGNETYIANNCQ